VVDDYEADEKNYLVNDEKDDENESEVETKVDLQVNIKT